MKAFTKAAIGALVLAGAAMTAAAPADARVAVGIGIGVPGPYYGAPYYGPSCPYWGYSPYCDYGYYDGPVFIDGVWVGGGHFRHRFFGGHHQFWYNNGWHNGGWGRGGHWSGRGGFGGHGRGHR